MSKVTKGERKRLRKHAALQDIVRRLDEKKASMEATAEADGNSSPADNAPTTPDIAAFSDSETSQVQIANAEQDGKQADDIVRRHPHPKTTADASELWWAALPDGTNTQDWSWAETNSISKLMRDNPTHSTKEMIWMILRKRHSSLDLFRFLLCFFVA